MTPQLEAAIAAIQPLPPIERQQLPHILTQGNSDPMHDLKTLSTEFWKSTPLQQVRATQNPMTVHHLQDLVVDFWPAEDSIEDFLSFLRQQRQEAI